MQEYTPEQQADIMNRSKEVLDFLKSKNFELKAYVTAQPVNNEDVFGIKVIPFLSDTKYLPKVETPKIGDPTKEEPTVSPFVAQPSTDENNSETKD